MPTTPKTKKPGPIPARALNQLAECRSCVWLDTEHAAGKIFLVTCENLPA